MAENNSKSSGNSDSNSSTGGKRKYTRRQIERMTSAGARRTYGRATIGGKSYPRGRGQDPAARAEIEQIRQAAEKKLRAKESPAQTYIRTLRERGGEAGRRYAQRLEEERFKKEYSQLQKELKEKGYKTTAAQVYVHATLRGEPIEAVVKRYDKDVKPRTIRETNILDTRISRPDLVEIPKKEESKVKRFVGKEGLLAIPSAIVKGFWKSFKYAAKPIKTPQESWQIIRDPHVQTFLLGTGLVVAPPLLSIPVATGFYTKQVYETVKEPTPEKLGVLTFMTGAIAIGAKGKLKGKVKIKTGKIGDIKTTIFYAKTKGEPAGIGFKAGKRAFVFAKGQRAVPPPPSAIQITTKYPIAISPKQPYPVPVPRPIVKPKTYTQAIKTEAVKAAELQLRSEFYAGEIKPVLKTPSKLRRVYRKGIVAKRSIVPLDVSPKGIFAKELPSEIEVKILKKPSAKQLRKLKRKEIVGKRSIRPLEIPESPLTKYELYAEPKELMKLRKKEAVLFAQAQTRGAVARGEIRVTPETPSRLRRARRKELVAKRSIQPLDVSAKPPFIPVKELPLYQRPQPARFWKKEARIKAEQQLRAEVLGGEQRLVKELPSKIRKAARRQITRRMDWWAEQKRAIGVEVSPEVIRTPIRPLGERPLPTKRLAIIKRPKPLVKPKASEIFKAKPPEKLKVSKGFKEIRKGGLIQIVKTKLEAPKVQIVSPKAKIPLSQYYGKQVYSELQTAQAYSVFDKFYGKPKDVSRGFKRLGKFKRVRKAFAGKLGIAQRWSRLAVSLGGTKPIRGVKQVQPQAQAQLNLQKMAQSQAQLQDQMQLQTQAMGQLDLQTQAQFQELGQLKDIGKTTTTTKLIDVPPPPLLIFPEPKPFRRKRPTKEELLEQAHDVYIKRKQLKKGKGSYLSRGYKRANKEPLTREAAHGLGMSITDTYANRSYLIKKAKGRIEKKRADLEAKARMLRHKFRAKKGNKNIIVEKTKHAIDSFQELNDITFEGIKARKKQIKQQLFLGIAKKKKKKQVLNLLATKQKLLKKKSKVKWL